MAGGVDAALPQSNVDFSPLAAVAAVSIKREWEVEYARFFNYPRFRSSSPSLKPLPKCKIRSRGTWVSSSSPASLRLLYSPSTILAVSILGKIHEEHFVSNLHFSWAQLSCETDCPMRGSRVLFVSFMDAEAQNQKFALRFSTGCDVQLFLNSVKESVKAIFDIGFTRSDFECKNSYQSEYIASNALCHRNDEESSFVSLNVGDQSEVPIVKVEGEKLGCSQHSPLHSPLGNNLENTISALPPSFTELLTDCMSENVTKEPPEVPEGIDLISQVTGYILDPSFREFLTKVDWIINELGGDTKI